MIITQFKFNEFRFIDNSIFCLSFHIRSFTVLILFLASSIVSADDLTETMVESARTADIKTLKQCLDKGADINAKNKHDLSAIRAIVYGNAKRNREDDYIKAAQILLMHSIKTKTPISELDLALNTAGWVKSPSLKLITLLLEYGADPNYQNPKSKNMSVLHLILQWSGRSKNSVRDIVEQLLIHKADPNLVVEGGETALHFAVRTGSPEVVKLLIKYGADINAVADAGYKKYTPAEEAVSQKDAAIAILLLEHGASPTAAEYLHFAIKSKNYSFLKMALKLGVDPNYFEQESKLSYPPLFEAVFQNDVKATKILLESGVDTTFIDEYKKTALDHAKERGYSDIVLLLQQHKP